MRLNPLRSLICRAQARAPRAVSFAAPNVLEAWPELWQADPLKTEETVFRELTGNPPPAPWSYLAIPWCVLLNRGWLNLVRLEPQTTPTFTVCQHIDYKQILPLLKKAGVTRLYAAHKMGEDEGIEVLPLPLLPYHDVAPSSSKDVFVSFMGCDHKRELNALGKWSRTDLRRRILQLVDRPGFEIVERPGWHFKGKKTFNDESYRSVLSRSRYSLCPRGTGPNSLRLWESLTAGAIPVVFADALALPDLEGVSWKEVIIRIPESVAGEVEAYLTGIGEDEELRRRELCLATANKLLGPGQFSQFIRHTLGEA